MFCKINYYVLEVIKFFNWLLFIQLLINCCWLCKGITNCRRSQPHPSGAATCSIHSSLLAPRSRLHSLIGRATFYRIECPLIWIHIGHISYFLMWAINLCPHLFLQLQMLCMRFPFESILFRFFIFRPPLRLMYAKGERRGESFRSGSICVRGCGECKRAIRQVAKKKELNLRRSIANKV